MQLYRSDSLLRPIESRARLERGDLYIKPYRYTTSAIPRGIAA